MKVLLINNRTIRLKQTQEMLKKFKLTTIHIKDLSSSSVKDHDFIVLTGGNYATAFTKSKAYDFELDLIKNSKIPLFGICLGMQLISRAFCEIKFKEIKPRRKKIMEINYKNKIIYGYNSHRWSIPYINSPLIKVSESVDGVEIIKHETKPIWGVQFHPEVDAEFGTNGSIVFNDFLTTYFPKLII